ncbi:hypothetical protein V6N12_022610 [Hibiscus sabdariffa]|uniref:RNase H type-1 domain-containing protein n=1 Tax=Hibiscus sabdariffa TaxID=183260 RepID=A0ABR2FV73_9ROSI
MVTATVLHSWQIALNVSYGAFLKAYKLPGLIGLVQADSADVLRFLEDPSASSNPRAQMEANMLADGMTDSCQVQMVCSFL